MNLIQKEGYTLCGEYINTQIKVLLKCKNEHDWSVKPCDFKSGARCPNCPHNESRGEKLVREFLESLGIKFSTQAIFPFLPNNRYDFILSIMVIILS